MRRRDSDSDTDFDAVSLMDLLASVTVTTARLGDHVRERSGKLGHEVRQRSQQLRDLASRQKTRVFKNPPIAKFSGNVRRQLARLDNTFSTKLMVSKTEKVWYAASIVNILMIGFMMGAYPEWLHVVYTVQLGLVLPIRFYTYFKRNYNYYLADLCYFVNLLSLLFLWVWPAWVHLWVACYAFSFGTLSFAIITWRNSLVLHSVDKTTSTLIHIFPPAVFHSINHLLEPAYRDERFPAVSHLRTWHMVQSLTCTTVAYFLWQTLYHFFITWRCQDKIKAGQVTSFEFLRKAYRDTRLGKFVNSLPGPFPVIAFTFIQFGYQMSTMMLCPLWYRYKVLSSLFLMFLLFTAAYNGATYYIDIFGQRFHKELQRLQRELEQMTDAQSEPSSATPSAHASTTNLVALNEKLDHRDPASGSSAPHSSAHHTIPKSGLPSKPSQPS